MNSFSENSNYRNCRELSNIINVCKQINDIYMFCLSCRMLAKPAKAGMYKGE